MLSKKQKRVIKVLALKYSPEEISKKLSVPLDLVTSYLKAIGIHAKKPNPANSFVGHITSQVEHITLSWFLTYKWIFIGLFALVFIVYGNAINNGFVSDDLPLINDPRLGTFEYAVHDPRNILRTVLYTLVFDVFGISAPAFRLTSIFFHLFSVWFVFILMYLFTNTRTALIASALFAVHPLIAEPIIWISGGIYPQYSMMVLAGLICYILGLKNKRFYIAAFVCLILSLLISEKAIVFPFLILLFDAATGRLSKNWKWYGLFFVIMLIFLGFISRLFFERLYLLANTYYLESGYDNPLFLIPVALSNYVFLFFWPKRLTLYHTEISPSVALLVVQVIAALIYIGALIMTYRKNKTLFFFLSFFIIALLPFLTPFRITWIVAERYVYLGSIGLVAIVSMFLSSLIKKYNQYKDVVISGIVLLLIILSIRTIVRNSNWKNEDTLWVATVQASPTSHNAHNNMGDVYVRQGNFQAAAVEFSQAIQIKPDYADAYHNLANTYQNLKNYDQALAFYNKALELNPNLWQSHVQKAGLYAANNDLPKAEEELAKALTISPNNPEILTSFAILYFMSGDNEQSRRFAEQSYAINPNNARTQEILKQLQSGNHATIESSGEEITQ